MAKILLVEDDNNLRDIYQARLAAEGYELVTAADGEQALAIAVKEKPDLIISDVMMPKVSGFEMLDILRGTAGVQNTKVIMMTALSQAEDKARAEKLGADRYLVKSQVTLEDMAKTVQEVLGSSGTTLAPAPTTPPVVQATPVAVAPVPAPGQMPSQPQPQLVEDTAPNQEQDLLNTAASALTESSVPQPVRPEDREITPVTSMPTPGGMTYPKPPESADQVESDSVSVARKKIIQPITDLSKPSVDINTLLQQEEAKDALNAQQNDAPANATQVPPQPPLPPTDPNSIAL